MSSILVVCTGNICRSPMAEGLLKRLLSRRGIDEVEVSSAGVAGWEGSGATPEAVRAMAEDGVDISGHVARRLDASMVTGADLIVALAREHSEAMSAMVPESVERTFTIKELVNLLDQLPGRPATTPPSSSPDERVSAAAAAANELRSKETVAQPSDMDVADPLGLGVQSYLATAWELESLCERLVDGVFGEANDQDEPAAAEGGRSE